MVRFSGKIGQIVSQIFANFSQIPIISTLQCLEHCMKDTPRDLIKGSLNEFRDFLSNPLFSVLNQVFFLGFRNFEGGMVELSYNSINRLVFVVYY